MVGGDGSLQVPKPESLELNDHDCWYKFRARVLEGELMLVPMVPLMWGLLVSFGGGACGEGLEIEVVDVAVFVADVAEAIVGDFLEVVVSEMIEEVAFNVCFEEDAPSVWECRHHEFA